jgi:putative FmdB family regulatory protein
VPGARGRTAARARCPAIWVTGRVGHAVYEYHCDKCAREVTLTLSIREHEKGEIKSPKCGGKTLQPLLSAFMSQTSKKS